ncbi:MAG: ATP-binding protein [Longimicrobiales bacterium]|nr:ATP-binding protein [Longimicrobiales bacterium]
MTSTDTPKSPEPDWAPVSLADAVVEEADRATVQRALDEIVHTSLRPVSAGLGLLFTLLVGAHASGLEGVARDTMMPTAGFVAVAIGLIWWMLTRDRLPIERAHAVAGIIGLLVLAHSLVQLLVLPEPDQASFLFLTVLGAGILFLDLRWFLAVTTGAFLGLYAVHARTPEGQDPQVWINVGIGLFGVSVLAGFVLYLRRRTFERVEALHLQDQARQLELEGALARTEEARRGEADARRELEGALRTIRESEERFRRLADSAFEGVIVSRQGMIRDANERAAQMSGLTLERLIGRDFGVLLHDECRNATLGEITSRLDGRSEAVANDAPAESTGVRADGTTYPLEIRVGPAMIEGERVAVMVLRDATHQKRAERVLRDAADSARESNRAKSAFLANMSHELRTPLNAVIGFSNILRKNKDGSFSDRDLEYVDRIVSNGKHLLALINDVLDLSKIEAGRMELVIETVDVEELARDVYRSFDLQARRKGVELRLEIPKRVHPIEGDGHRLKQVLFNLVGNAMKFTDEGSITLRVTPTEDGITPRRLEVVDSGIGIPESRIREIFDPFQQVDATTTRKYGGTGLGLAISRHLCAMMGFSLDATSVVGEGSTFRIDFRPAVPPVVEAPPPEAPVETEA